ncbi:MAG: GNAT family N-acetyltransferase [Candidatus Pacebacteria bacterium]|nr:GNAT family N-acetyltransferase [Candidatus Paceibacterota bacterium]
MPSIYIRLFHPIESTTTNAQEVSALMKQLSPERSRVTEQSLRALAENHLLFVVLADQKIVGMATLIEHRALNSYTGYIEDVVVDGDYRGQGIAKKLMRTLIKHGTLLGMVSFSLTSSPRKESANKLYRALGFFVRETNAYRYVVS